MCCEEDTAMEEETEFFDKKGGVRQAQISETAARIRHTLRTED